MLAINGLKYTQMKGNIHLRLSMVTWLQSIQQKLKEA